MEVEFALDEADLAALAKHHMENSPAIRRRYRIRWIGASLGMGIMGLSLYAFFSVKSPSLYLGAFALFFLIFYPYYYRWLVGRTMRRIVKARMNPKAFATRTLRTTPEGLEMISAGSNIAGSWDRVSGVEVKSDRAFIAVDGEYIIVVPRARLSEDSFQSLIDTLERCAKPALR